MSTVIERCNCSLKFSSLISPFYLASSAAMSVCKYKMVHEQVDFP